MWNHLARDPPRRVVVAEKRLGTLGGGLDVVAVRGEAAPAPQAHRTAPYRSRCSLDQRAAGQDLGGLGTPRRGMYLLGRRAPRRDNPQVVFFLHFRSAREVAIADQRLWLCERAILTGRIGVAINSGFAAPDRSQPAGLSLLVPSGAGVAF